MRDRQPPGGASASPHRGPDKVPPGAPAARDGVGDPARLRYLQATAGNAAVGRLIDVQRAAAEASATASPVKLGAFTLNTYADLLAAARFFAAELRTDADQLPAGVSPRTAADELIGQEQAWEPLLERRGTDALDEGAANQAGVWYKEFVRAGHDVESYQKDRERAGVRKAVADAEKALASVEAIPDQFAELQRAAFLAKNDELLEHITETLGYSLQVASALIEVHEKASEVLTVMSAEASHLGEVVEKLTPVFELAHKVVASFEALTKSLAILHGGEGFTEVDKEMSKVSAGFGLASAAGSLTGVGAVYMVYFATVLSAAQRIVGAIKTIVREQRHQFNEIEFSSGSHEGVDWSAEPGGREVFEFMAEVMKAESADEIPMPLPKEVDEFVVEAGEQFAKGTGEEVPTKGFWRWKHTDPANVRQWLFVNRRNVWAMLYGSVQPPG